MKKMQKMCFVLVLFVLPFFVFAQGSKDAATQKTPAAASPSNTTAVTDTDGLGRKVTLHAAPQRIVSLGPSTTEILFAIGSGDRLVGRTEFCNYPMSQDAYFAKKAGSPGVEAVPIFGGFSGKTFSIEKLVSVQPDLVVGFATMHDFLIEPLAKYGIPFYVSNATTIDSVYTEIQALSALTGTREQGKACVDQVKKRIAAVSLKNSSRQKPSVYWEVWNNPYMSIGKQSFINELIAVAGGKNIFDDIDQGYPVVSEESLVLRNPAVILLPADSGTIPADIKNRNGWKSVAAVTNGKIFLVNSDIVSRPGPRIAQAVEDLSALFYGRE